MKAVKRIARKKPTKRPKPDKWFKQRMRIWRRDGGKCIHCKVVVNLSQSHVDHIIPISATGSNRDSNLRLLCVSCHALRDEPNHVRLRAEAIKNKLLPLDWKKRLWKG